MDSDGDQPADTAGVEHDVRATQQDRPGDLAGVFDDRVADALGAVADRALQSVRMRGEERGDLLVAALGGDGHGLASWGPGNRPSGARCCGGALPPGPGR